jgi:hypothetical protein
VALETRQSAPTFALKVFITGTLTLAESGFELAYRFNEPTGTALIFGPAADLVVVLAAPIKLPPRRQSFVRPYGNKITTSRPPLDPSLGLDVLLTTS